MLINLVKYSVILLAFVCLSCSEARTLDVDSHHLLETVQCPHEDEVKDLTQPQKNMLGGWCSDNKSDWKSSPVSYMPNIVIRGNDITINILSELVVVNQKSRQLVKPLESSKLLSLCTN